MTDPIRVLIVDDQQPIHRGPCGHARHGWPRLGCGVSTVLACLVGHYSSALDRLLHQDAYAHIHQQSMVFITRELGEVVRIIIAEGHRRQQFYLPRSTRHRICGGRRSGVSWRRSPLQRPHRPSQSFDLRNLAPVRTGARHPDRQFEQVKPHFWGGFCIAARSALMGPRRIGEVTASPILF